jgi:hypothetical protein
LIALANIILSIPWYLLKHQQSDHDLGADYFHCLQAPTQRYNIQQLEKWAST